MGSDLGSVAAWTAWLGGGWWAALEMPRNPSETLELHDAGTIHLSPEALLQGGEALASPMALLSSGSRALVFCAGPDLDPWVEELEIHNPEARLTAVYGSPQISPVAAAWRSSPRGRVSVPFVGQLHLLDRRLRPCGIGTVGSLWIGEGGLPSGIDGDPKGTADRLRPDPFSKTPGGRMFASLDRGKISAQGVLELVGREDRQLKVGGVRVEPAEIENCLLAHPAVSQCSVVRRDGLGRDDLEGGGLGRDGLEGSSIEGSDLREGALDETPRLVAFVVRGSTAGLREAPALFAAQASLEGPSLLDELEFSEETVLRILRCRPRHLLEVGAEDLSLASRLGPVTERYLIKAGLGRLGRLGRLDGSRDGRGTAEGIERRLEDFGGLENRFDTVVLGPWIRHLPSVDFLVRILDGAAAALKPGGMIFLAGVDNERLRTLRHLRRILAAAPKNLPAHALRNRLRQACDNDEGLSLSSAFFGALRGARQWLSAVAILPVRTSTRTPAPVFHFDVMLAVDTPPRKMGAPESLWKDWESAGISLSALRAHLRREEPESLGFTGVPYQSLEVELKAFEDLEARARTNEGVVADILRARDSTGNLFLQPDPSPGVDPEDFWRLADDLPYRVEVSWARSGRSGSFDVLLHHRRNDRGEGEMPRLDVPSLGMPGPEIRTDPLAWFAREPFRGIAADRFGLQLESFLATKLPAHLVPRTIVIVPTLPDLEASEKKVPEAELPSTPTEKVVAGIWGDLLGISEMAVALSITPSSGGVALATRLARHLNRCFGTEMTPHQVLLSGSIGTVAATVDALLVERLIGLDGEEGFRGGAAESSGLGLGGIGAVDGHGK